MDLPERKHPRLKNYDYNAGGTYFLTLCTKNKKSILSQIVGRDDLGTPELMLTDIGRIVDKYILSISEAYEFASVVNYVIMPKHVHLLITLYSGVPVSSRPTELIPRIVSALKHFSNLDSGQKLWQDGYYDHIIRDEQDYLIRWKYIYNNPAKWENDEYNSN